MITSQQFDKWITALRSGEYEQGQEQLRRTNDDGTVGYCCLGLFQKIIVDNLDEASTGDNTAGWFPDSNCKIADLGGIQDTTPFLSSALTHGQRNLLAEMNDGGASFEDIADYLEVHRDEFVED